MDGELNSEKFGLVMTGAGAILFFGGMVFKFHRLSLVFSNVLFFLGIYLQIGQTKFIKIFTHPKRIPGSICFGLGFVIIIFNYGILGSIMELVGVSIVFGDFLMLLTKKMRNVPVLGPLLTTIIPKFTYKADDDDLLPR